MEQHKARKVVGLSLPFPGARRPLEEGAKLGMWDFVPLEGPRVQIPPADVYILAAWDPIYERLLNIGGKIGVLFTSSAGEMDLEPVEQEYLRGILADPRVSFVWFGDKALAEVYPEKGFWAPYPLETGGELPKVQKQDIVTLFCPTGPKKNSLNTLLGVRLAQRRTDFVLHTNIQGYDDVLRDVKHVRHGWLKKEDYQALLASARLNLAVSWCETYCYSVAEAGLLGTASLVSWTVPVPGVVVNNPNDPQEIAECIIWALGGQGFTDPAQIRYEVEQFARRQNQVLKDILTQRLASV